MPAAKRAAKARLTMAKAKTAANKKRSQPVPAPTKTALELVGYHSKTDVNGSYTGIPVPPDDQPVQDVDDL